MTTKNSMPRQSIDRLTMKIGLVAGNFDVIHPGYVKMFEDAKKNACNYLVVALQSDPTIDRPEKSKPVQTVEEREYILKSIRYVDKVIHYNTEKELLDILTNFDYDIRILGSDYNIPDKIFTGYQLSKKIYFHNRDHDYSATNLKERIARSIKK
jgi:glycerol-3-phosphate cytidylyltransferase